MRSPSVLRIISLTHTALTPSVMAMVLVVREGWNFSRSTTRSAVGFGDGFLIPAATCDTGYRSSCSSPRCNGGDGYRATTGGTIRAFDEHLVARKHGRIWRRVLLVSFGYLCCGTAQPTILMCYASYVERPNF